MRIVHAGAPREVRVQLHHAAADSALDSQVLVDAYRRIPADALVQHRSAQTTPSTRRFEAAREVPHGT